MKAYAFREHHLVRLFWVMRIYGVWNLLFIVKIPPEMILILKIIFGIIVK